VLHLAPKALHVLHHLLQRRWQRLQLQRLGQTRSEEKYS
jgi:hypothetical protein